MYLACFILTCYALGVYSFNPNILLIVTDDQDSILNGMFPMTNVLNLIGAAGATFTNAFTSSPLCCPSRASILTGLYAHNHKSINNSISGGCYNNFWRENVETNNTMPVLLQNAGYKTFFAGKYMNQYKGDRVPPGWDDFHGLHGNSRYYNYTLRENESNNSYTNTYFTDLIRDLAVDFLSKTVSFQPFFLTLAPPAPHAPFTPAERHLNIFDGVKAPRTPNFNKPFISQEKHWLLSYSDKLGKQTIDKIDKFFQQRWESLLAVDELVLTIVNKLRELKQLEKTYIIYTSDNGFHVGQFALPLDKRQPYETDIKVPLLIRGPNILPGSSFDIPVLLIDLLPTLLEFAGISTKTTFDGLSFYSYLINTTKSNQLFDQNYHRSLLIEHWGEGNDASFNPNCPGQREDFLAFCIPELECHCQDVRNNTYACVRHFHNDTNVLYCEFNDKENFVEAYDLHIDPYQMTNLGFEMLPIARAFYSLALSNLTSCIGSSCNEIYI